MAISINTEVAGGYSVVPFVDTINASKHINRILQGADVARHVRPDATYSTVRYATQAGAGLKDGTSLENAYGRAELNTALATLSSAHVYLSGTFEPEAYNTAGPIIGPVIGDNVRLDLATYDATVRGYSGATWTASGTNGEYYATAANNQVGFRLTEDGLRMRGVSGSDCGAGMTITAIDATADTVTLTVYRALQANDEIVFISSTANGLTVGTKYYVKTATDVSSGSQTLTLSATLGGATLDITGTLSGTKRMWSLVGGRDGDPVPGSLQAGEYAWAPELSRVYMKPSSGTPSDHTYTWWQTGSTPSCITAGSAAVTASMQIIGGEMYGAPAYGIFMGDSSGQGYVTSAVVYGTVVHSCESGIVSSGAENSDCQWNRVYDCTDHAIGSKNGTNNELGLKLHYNWVYDLARQPWDSGDCQALVTNPSSDDAWFHGNVVQRVGHQRDYTNHPLGLNDTVNTGAAVVDSSKRVVITGNYFEECYGETVEIGPNDVQAITQLLVAGNVFDQRNLLPALQEPTVGSEQSAAIRVLITSSAIAGYGVDYTNVVRGNLALLGVSRSSTATSIDSAALVAVRNAKTGAATEAKIKVRDNVVCAIDANYAWDMLAVRYTSTSSSVTGIDSDNNTYYSASASGRGVVVVGNTNNGQSGATTVALASLGDGTGWTSPDGTVSDKHSTVWTASDLEDTMPTNPTVLRCLGL